MGFPSGSDGKDSACKVGDPGSIPGLGRSPGERNGNPLQYSCLENPMGRGAWQVVVHSVAKSQTRLKGLDNMPPPGRVPVLHHLERRPVSVLEENRSSPNNSPAPAWVG